MAEPPWRYVFDYIRVPAAFAIELKLPRRSWRGYTVRDDMVFVDRRRWRRQLRRARLVRRKWQRQRSEMWVWPAAALVDLGDLSASDIEGESTPIAAASRENKE